MFRNPGLAKTYRLLAQYGPSYLYDGPLGQAIVQADDHPVLTPGQTVVQLPGILTTSDLRAYQAQVLAPTRVSYRGLDIYSMAPPSSSGSTVGETLNILSGYNLSAEPRVTRACFSRSAWAWRLMASCRLAGMATSRISTELTVTPHSAVLAPITSFKVASAVLRSDRSSESTEEPIISRKLVWATR